MAANVNTGIKMDATNVEFKVNRMCKDLTKRKHNLAEGRTTEEVGVHKCTFIVVFVNLSVVKK